MTTHRLAVTLLLCAALLAPGMTQAQPGIATPDDSWTSTCVDCPKLVRSMSPHCLRLDAQGQPHVVYGGDDLYYAFYDGAAWRVETVDDAPGSVAYPALALAPDGTPHVSYTVPGSVMHAWRDQQGWHVEVIDETGTWQPQTALAIDSHGFPAVAYSKPLENSSRELVMARQDAAGWQINYPLPGESNVGWLSLVLDGNDLPHVAYVRFYRDDIKVAYEDTTGWHVEAVETRVNDASWSTSLAIGADGKPWIAYVLHPNTIKVAYRDTSGWHRETIGAGRFASLVTGTDGRPSLSYIAESGLMYSTLDTTGWHGELVDPAATLGLFNSLALDSGAAPHLAYFDLATATLRYSRPNGTSWAIESVDTAANVGLYSSLALDAADRGHVGYYDATREAVKYAVKDQAAWRVETVDTNASASNARISVSLALDSQGQPHLSYPDAASRSVKYAERTGSGWQIEVVDPQADVGTSVSLALDTLGMPHVAYRGDGPEKSISYATRDAAGWQIEVVTTQGVVSSSKPALALSQAGDTRIAFIAQMANSPGIMVAARNPTTGDWEIEPVVAINHSPLLMTMAIDLDGAAHVAWSDWSQSSDHGVVQHAVQEPAGWRIETVDAGGLLSEVSLALDAGGHPFISLIDRDQQSGAIELRVAYRDAAGWHIETPDLAGQQPASPALALDQAGRPLFSYYDAVTGDLRLAGRAAAPPITSTPPDPLPWQATCIDCPRAFDSLADHSLQVDSQGWLHVAYGGDHLYYARFDGVAWQRAVVDAAPGVGRYASLALDPNGAPSIAYYDAVRGDLKMAWSDAGEWRTTVVESTGDVGRFASLALDQAGSPHISYFDASQQRLRYATRDAAGWRLETVATQDLSDATLALTIVGQPRIAYAAGDGLAYAYRDSAGWHVEAVGDPQVYGARVSLAFDGAGQPHIAYSGGGDLGYAWRDAAAWRAESVVQGETSSPALALDPAGAPHISYRFHRERDAKHELRYVRREDAGSGWRTETIDASYELEDDASALALDAAGIAQIIYLVDSVLTLASHGPQGGWTYQAVDESSWASGSDLALDGRGELHASYLTGGARAGRWYATRDGAGWQRDAVAAPGRAAIQAGGHSGGAAGRRIAVDADGAPHLTYTTFYRDPVDPQGDHSDLWYAHKGFSTAQWSIERPDPSSGSGPALALDASGMPHISYRKRYQYPSSSALYYAARCGSSWRREQVDGAGDDYFAGSGSSLAFDSAGQAQISYLVYVGYDAAVRQLKLAVKHATGWRIEVVDEDVDVYQTSTALALDADQPWVAYTKHFDLMLAFRDGADWRHEVVEDAGSVSGSIELAIDSQGQPRIGYFNGGRLRYAVRTSQGWQLHDVEPAGLAACCSAGFVLGPDDTPFFAFTDADSKDFLLVTTAARTECIWLPLVLKGRVQ